MSKKILLVICPIVWPKMPPIGIGYIQAFLLKNGFEANLLDLNNIFYNLSSSQLKRSWLTSCNKTLEEKIFFIIQDDFGEVFDKYLQKMFEYDTIGFSCFKSNLGCTLEVIKILKSRRPDINILLGGPEITRQFFRSNGRFEKIMLDLSNLLVVGEGELSILNYITKKDAHPKISRFLELPDLKDLPFPEYRGVDLKNYPKNDSIPMLFSKGCVRKCRFCSERLLYKNFRQRPVKNILEEISYHQQQNMIKYFIFHDSMINASLENLEELCDGIIDRFGSINWEAQLYIREMDEGLLEKMKLSGCYNLFIGLESGSDTTLQRMNKGFTTKDAINLFRKLTKVGLSFGISLITGYPGETEKDHKESLDFVIKNRQYIPKIEQINPFTYYDGTDVDIETGYSFDTAIRRFNEFVQEIKHHSFRYTNAFLGNLIERYDPV